QWLIQNGFQGLEGQQVPLMTDEIVNEISNRYIELYESITGLQFVKADNTNMQLRIESAVNKYLACL
ncbi:MAG TPA: phosphoribosylaminoimidazolesuccinocarboxamide synthase, partial [Bacteroidia bacterium]|nr:phosphoribosylaminoimidazolesuccinocarboxamide synthase [Bacteroidia bacterium]